MAPLIAAILAAILLGTPLAARAQAAEAPESIEVPSNPARCARYAREIIQYQQMAGRAAKLGNQDWEAKLEAHVELLRDRAEPQCPEIKVSDSTWESLKLLLRLAGQAAVAYFTFGAF